MLFLSEQAEDAGLAAERREKALRRSAHRCWVRFTAVFPTDKSNQIRNLEPI